MKKKVLIADDSRHIVRAISVLLGSEDFKVITASSGKECLNKMEKEKPDLILLDILMPTSGVEVLKQILKLNPKAKVAMLTVMGQKKVIEDCKRLGAVDYITKPFDNAELVSRVKKIVG